MIRRGFMAVVASACAIGGWAACVGDDPSTPANQGAQDQPCYANGTCLTGLACMSGTCKPAGSTSSGSSGSTSSSSGSTSGSSGSSSGSASTCKVPTPLDAGPHCVDGGSCPMGQTCCSVGTGFACAATCQEPQWQCEDSESHCTDALSRVCCITNGDQDGLDSCGVRLFAGATSQCGPAAACTGGAKQVRTCKTAADCAAEAHKDCVLHNVKTVAGAEVIVGICEAARP